MMEKLGINEKGFALLMNVAPFTVRLWTSGASQPSGTAMHLMQIFETAPEIVSKIAGESENRRIVNGRERNNSVGENIEKIDNEILNYIFLLFFLAIRYNETGVV